MENYSNIRELIGHYVGKKLVDVTQHDAEEFDEDGVSYVLLMFEGGLTIQFDIGDDGGFHYQSPDDEPEVADG